MNKGQRQTWPGTICTTKGPGNTRKLAAIFYLLTVFFRSIERGFLPVFALNLISITEPVRLGWGYQINFRYFFKEFSKKLIHHDNIKQLSIMFSHCTSSKLLSPGGIWCQFHCFLFLNLSLLSRCHYVSGRSKRDCL